MPYNSSFRDQRVIIGYRSFHDLLMLCQGFRAIELVFRLHCNNPRSTDDYDTSPLKEGMSDLRDTRRGVNAKPWRIGM